MTSHQKTKIKKPRILKSVPVFAHRGGMELGYDSQNTLSAFENSYKNGIRHFETDVILTHDGKVVAFHGAQNLFMEKRSGLMTRKKAQRLTYDQLKGASQLPLMRDLIKEFPDVFFSIDAKTADVVGPLVELLVESKAENRVCITSFRLKRTIKARRLIQESVRDFDNASLCLYSISVSIMSLLPVIAFSYFSRKGIKILQIPHSRINTRIMNAAKQAGISVYAWTVNNKDEANRLKDVGVDGIISDYPITIIKA